jgi:cytochrome c biogenesis protein ResB
VEITAGGAARQLWLQRNGQEQTPQIIETKAGKLGVTFDFDTLPLPFSLRLVKFTHGLNPGGVGDASYASMVQILNESHQVSGEQEISMNQPLTNGKFTFYQSGMLPGDSGTVLSAACDPGKHTKYAGSLLICLGCCLMLFKRVNFFDRLSAFPSQKST